ncbi:MAG TPA: preprotein translocase subunit SecE [Solirubrobacterales bacterium]|nr:preprotein translocase subunit SecE [Solirubrobacterales bacterium]
MAKTRAQRKAERRAREAEERKRTGDGRDAMSRAQHDTQVPRSGDEALIEAEEIGMAIGAPESAMELPEHTKPSRAERRAESKAVKEAEKRKRDEQKRREREQLAKKEKKAREQRQRGGVIAFLASCWAELKKVQWPDRDTLVQATAVTILFVAVAAAYLGALDAAFNWLIKQIL